MYQLSDIETQYKLFLKAHSLFMAKEWESMSDEGKAEYKNCFNTYTKFEFAVQASANFTRLMTEFTKVGF